MTIRTLFVTALGFELFIALAGGATLIEDTSTWRYLKGLGEASSPPDAWRAVAFNDTSWSQGPAAFYYGEPLTGTELTDMRGSYSTVYFRKTFNLTDASQVGGVVLNVNSDDGFIAWINGVEVARYNMDPGDIAFNGNAVQALEPTTNSYTIINQAGLLHNGDNVLAVHGFNASLADSSDFVFVANLESISAETTPPVVQSRSPNPGMVTNLSQITVVFSEPVSGVNASDLLINGTSATTLAGGGASYSFGFPQPLYGPVSITWATEHGIVDLALPPNPFDSSAVGAAWQYTLVDQTPPTVASLTPTAGSTVASLTQIDVIFSEGVSGVNAADLTVNGAGASSVVANSPSFYSFQFPEPNLGLVNVEWAGGHGIQDLAPAPNPFGGGAWTYLLDPESATTLVVISEFMASNGSILKDEDGNFSDWIELFNAGTSSVNLFNWALTDSAGDLMKWQFPSTNLPPGEFLVVFASEKDRRVAGGELHTNFKLDTGGEYLALARPDGSIASEYSPQYPGQVADVSYGLGFEVSAFTVVQSNAPVRVLVPSSAALANTWTQSGFNDSSWTAGINGVGYDTGQTDPGENAYEASVDMTSPIGYWRLNETAGTVAMNRGSGGTSLNGTYQGGVTLGQPGPRPPSFGGFEAGNNAARFNGSSHYASTAGGLLSNRGSFTIGGWINPAATPGARIGLFGQNDAVEFGFISGATLQIWTPSGGTIDVNYPFPINTWHHVAVVADGQNLRVFLDGAVAGTGGTATANYGSSTFLFNIGGGGVFDNTGNFFNGLIDEVVLYQRALTTTEVALLYSAGLNAPNTSLNDLIATDIQSAMFMVNSTAYIRIPFSVSNPSIVDRLKLRVRYDDGFSAFLNQQLVASANSPLTPAWNAAATTSHADFAARTYVDFDLPGAATLLAQGNNVLAIHGLNSAASGNDFLIQAQLEATSIGAVGTTPRYFLTPTPGAPNGVGSGDLGPIISDVSHTPAVPTDDESVTVIARVDPSFRPLTTVTLHWQGMYRPLNEVAMLDDGLHGDGAADDRVFGAVIPPSSSTNGEMLRWYVTAEDTQGNPARWPLFDDPLDSQEFLGTLVANPNIESELPVIHLFEQTPSAAETRGGTRCSLFYLDEFYDNVQIDLHGQTSSGFAKKSFDLDFPKDHRFRYKQGEPRVKDIKWLTNWGDKSKVHNVLGYEFIRRAGSVGHFAFQVRIQQNTRFFSITDMVEDADDRWLERVGRDPNGALYKIYDNLAGTGSAEKKTRRQEGVADLQALISGLTPSLPLSNRVVYAYDNIDIPQAISYLAVCALISHQDHGHKNYYVYRDSDGTGEWEIWPWDIDLSWGRNWIDSGGYLTDTIYFDNVLDFYNLAQQNKGRNRFYDLFFEHPDFRAMYLRRLRTLVDTLLGPPGTSSESGLVETRIRQMLDQMDPPGVDTSDADLDYTRWGSWGNLNHMREEADRIINIHLPGRREFLINSPNAVLNGERLPGLQPLNVAVKIGALEFNPASGNQAQEYICLTNSNPFAVDISGWKLGGGVDFVFRAGTVVSGHGVLYVSPDVKAFRARTTGPRGGQGLYVEGPYQGQLSARGETVLVVDTFGRQVDQALYAGSPSAAQGSLRITELMYNPSPLIGNPADAQSFEYIELKNISATETISLNGVRFLNGVMFDFSASAVTSLAPGARVLVVKDPAAFMSRYPGLGPIAGAYTGSLNNGGDRVRLVDASGEEILDFRYNDTWYPTTDGLGFSLVIVDETAEPDAWSSAIQWRASGKVGGSPAAVDPAPPLIPRILVNEALSRSETPPPTDSIELYNPTSQTANIGDWYLTDDFNQPKKYRIPGGTTIAGNAFIVFDESQFNPLPGVPPSFALGSDGDQVYLFSGNTAGELTGYFHGFKFGAAENGATFGRHVTSLTNEHFVAQSAPTLGEPNAGPKVGPVVISEIHYHPPDGPEGSDNSADEYVELVNVSGAAASLFDPMFTSNTWQLTDAVEFAFPMNISLTAGERILIVNFDPVSDSTALSDFRGRFGASPSVRVFGPFKGQLNNSSDSVELKKPSTLPGLIKVLVLVDKVEYKDKAPWPAGADGFGLSLQRVDEMSYGNDPGNWVAGPPNAGAARGGIGNGPVLNSSPQSQTVLAGTTAMFSVNVSGAAPLSYQWRFKGGLIAGATAATLSLPNVQLSNLGEYDVVVYNNRGSVVSAPALLSVILPASIVVQPQSAVVAPGSQLTLSVVAFGSGNLSYRWFKNGIQILGATGPALDLPSVSLSDAATYVVEVEDSIGTIRSDPAVVQLLIGPEVVVQPVGMTNVVGSDVTFSVQVTNTATLPIGYRWRRGGTSLTNRISNSRVDFFTLSNIQLADAGTYSVVLTNMASPAPGKLSIPTRLGVVQPMDMDGDGLPDAYEMANGLNPNLNDANVDSDVDGFTNLQEFQAGTDPQDPQSYLKVHSLAATGNALIRFRAVESKTYSVLYRDQAGSGEWRILMGVPAQSGTSSATYMAEVMDPGPMIGQRYYRIITPGQSQ